VAGFGGAIAYLPGERHRANAWIPATGGWEYNAVPIAAVFAIAEQNAGIGRWTTRCRPSALDRCGRPPRWAPAPRGLC
jgi:hypothetical protein